MRKTFRFLAMAALAAATAAAAVEPRTWTFTAPTNAAIREQDDMAWVQGESVLLEYAIPDALEEGQFALWEVTQGTNLWLHPEAENGGTSLRWSLTPDETILPAGRYAGRVAVYSTDGGTTTFHRVLAQQGCRVYKGIADFEALEPLPWYDRSDLDALEAELANLRGELQGPAWLTPARFSWEAEGLTTVTTNIGEETDSGWAVLTRPRTVVRESGYVVRPVIERNQWDAELEVATTGPATLSAVGDGSYTLAWNPGTETGSTATVSGQLGDWRTSQVLTMDSPGTVQTQHWFSSFAPGGVREDLAGVLAAWTNMDGNIYRFTNFSSGKTSTVETLSLTPNTNFWARECDLSGVSVWNDNGGYYYTKPGTLIASNLCYGAAHWSVAVGKTLAWHGKDGRIHASKVVDQRRMTGDLCVSKLSPPLDTNAVTAYPILELPGIDQKLRAGEGTVYGLPPMPVLAMSQAQRGWIMKSGIFGGGASGIWDSGAGAYIRNSRSGAVGGDSGHPVFVSTDATNLVLLGCYWTPTGLSLPGDDKALVLSAVEAMGADTNAVTWEAWTNYPSYLGPLPMPN